MPKAIDRLLFLMIVATVRGQYRHSEDTCVPGSRTTSLSGAMLMQSASTRNRFGDGERIENPDAKVNQFPTSFDDSSGEKSPAKRELVQQVALASSTDFSSTDSRKSNYSLGLGRVDSSAYSLAHSTYIGSWLRSISKSISHDNSGPLMFVAVLLLLMLGAAVCLWQYPTIKGYLDPPRTNPSTQEAFLGRPVERVPSGGQIKTASQSRSFSSQSPHMSQTGPKEVWGREGQSISGGPPRIQKVGGRSSPPCRNLLDDAPAPETLIDEDSALSRCNTVESQFCPELIVPQHSECLLEMPLGIDQSSSTFGITDVKGSAVLQVVTQPPTVGRLWRATITTTSGEMLAQCCESRSQAASGNFPEYQFMKPGGQMWAKLVKLSMRDRYMLTLLGGGNLQITGNSDNRSVNITDDQARLYANAEATATRYCRIRVAPLADVGLALCGILCVHQHMATQRRPGQ